MGFPSGLKRGQRGRFSPSQSVPLSVGLPPSATLHALFVLRPDPHQAVVPTSPRLLRLRLDLAIGPLSSLSSPQTRPVPSSQARAPHCLVHTPASLQAPPKPHSSPCPPIVHAPQPVLRSRLHSQQEILLVPFDHAPSFSQGSTLAPPPPHARLHFLRVPLGTRFHPVPSCRHPALGRASIPSTTHLPCRCR